jgi:triacylglycerol esterase/lipase EstA (alpha/beta hydrolase family)
MVAPTPVFGVSVENLLAGRRFLIEWDLNPLNQGITQYTVWRSTQEYQGFEKIATLNSPTYQFIDKVPYTFGVIFFYKVLAVNAAGVSSNITQSNAVSDQTFDDFEEKPFRATTLQFDALVTNETPGGTVDGVNKTFTTANLFRFDSLQVYLNGINRINANSNASVVDYTEGANQMSFTFSNAPAQNDIIVVTYLKL